MLPALDANKEQRVLLTLRSGTTFLAVNGSFIEHSEHVHRIYQECYLLLLEEKRDDWMVG
jgi:hypothetical protein